MPNKKPRPGFSLIDFLISLSILTFLITATAQLIIHSLFIKRRAEINLKIAELAASKLEYLKSFPFESDELKEGTRSEIIKEDDIQESFQRKWKIQDIFPGMKKIEMEIIPESFPQKKMHVVLFLSRELEF